MSTALAIAIGVIIALFLFMSWISQDRAKKVTEIKNLEHEISAYRASIDSLQRERDTAKIKYDNLYKEWQRSRKKRDDLKPASTAGEALQQLEEMGYKTK